MKSRPTQCEKSADAKVARKVARVNAALGLDINTKHTNLQTLGRQHKERQGEAKGPVRTVPQAWYAGCMQHERWERWERKEWL